MHKALAIGTITKGTKGMLIKVDSHRWRSYPKYVWEQAHSVKLGHNDRIIHMDGNKDNCAITNLYLISPKHTTFVFMHIKYPTNTAELDTLCAMADLHAELRRKEVALYGSSLGALKQNIMGNPARRAKHLAKQRERANKKRAENPEKAKEQQRAYYAAHREQMVARVAEYRRTHKAQAYAATAKWRKEHPAQAQAIQRKSYLKNKDKYNETKRLKRHGGTK